VVNDGESKNEEIVSPICPDLSFESSHSSQSSQNRKLSYINNKGKCDEGVTNVTNKIKKHNSGVTNVMENDENDECIDVKRCPCGKKAIVFEKNKYYCEDCAGALKK